MRESGKVFGWITGNNMRVRGFWDGKLGSDGEKWFTDEHGRGWSQYDVSFQETKPTLKEINENFSH